MVIIIDIKGREIKYGSCYGDSDVAYLPALVWNAFALLVKMVVQCISQDGSEFGVH